MISTIDQLITSYNPKTTDEIKLAIREILQQIILVGLSRSGFFNKASFYGGTALRIFYGLNRYSEDLDFTLNKKDEDFSLDPYINKIYEVASSYGLNLNISSKRKEIKTPIESAFAKINTYQTFINLKIDESLTKMLHKDEVIKVKFEIDTLPPLGFKNETKWLDNPEFAPVTVLDIESLFSGKLHAILCRNYKNTIKGRDYYDFLFYVKKGIKPNINYLKEKLIESKRINKDDIFNIDVLKEMLINRFKNIDFEYVKNDAKRFVFSNEDLSYFCSELFIQMAQKL